MLNYIKKKLTEYADINVDNISEETNFMQDLQLNSFDFVSMIGKVENELNIEIPDIEIRDLQTVGDLAGYLRTKIK